MSSFGVEFCNLFCNLLTIIRAAIDTICLRSRVEMGRFVLESLHREKTFRCICFERLAQNVLTQLVTVQSGGRT